MTLGHNFMPKNVTVGDIDVDNVDINNRSIIGSGILFSKKIISLIQVILLISYCNYIISKLGMIPAKIGITIN